MTSDESTPGDESQEPYRPMTTEEWLEKYLAIAPPIPDHVWAQTKRRVLRARVERLQKQVNDASKPADDH